MDAAVPAPADVTADFRQMMYRLMMVIAVAICCGKIAGIENLYEPSRYRPPTESSFGADRDDLEKPQRVWPTTRPEPTPLFSSNDKSRWATVRAIVENGNYVIAVRENFRDTSPPYRDSGIIVNKDGRLDSLDIVMNPETGQFYSSKPPLFATMLAVPYAVLYHGFGLSLDHDRFPIVIGMLLLINVVPFAIYLVLLARLIDRWGRSDFGRMFAFATACFGTYVTTFSMTLNNHTPAVMGVLFTIYLIDKDLYRLTTGRLFWAGFFAGFTVTFELPSACFAAAVFVILLVIRPRQTLLGFLPGMLLPIAALFACNYLALGRFRPAYSEFGGPWYEYGGSHWLKLREPVRPRGIDFNQESPPVYAFHMLFGHHGWFSLTPVWLIGLIGIAVQGVGYFATLGAFLRRRQWAWTAPALMMLTVVLSLILFAFFLSRTSSYNYGGSTSGLRWVFWLTPLWTFATLFGADWLAQKRRYWQTVAAILLGFSILSVFYPAANPWRNPWIMQLCERYGWVRYG